MLSNNLAESYALLQGLIIAKSLNLQNLIVIGDSLIIIKHMVQGTTPIDVTLATVIERIRKLISHFQSSFFTMSKGKIIKR
jgi:ribonuclease HI